jgi:hypothetical protein
VVGLSSAIRTTARGLGAAAGARPLGVALVALGLAALQVALPVAVLSVARKPWDYFAFNAWLPNLPHYLAGPAPSWPEKAHRVWDLALFWIMADGPYGHPEWGFAVSVGDVVRIAATSLLFAALFALWRHQRGTTACVLPGARRASAAGVAASVLGLSAGPCGVMGCGAPVLPVVALAFTGLSSGTLAWLAGSATWATRLVLAATTIVVVYLAWAAGAHAADRAGPRLEP